MELSFIFAVIIFSIIAISGYMRNAIAARVKTGADSFSPILANPERIVSATVRCQESTDKQSGAIAGYVRTTYTESSEQQVRAQGAATALPECDPALPEPN